MAERFYIDPYQTRLETRVARHDDAGLVLEDTLCYPLGGGQPGDTATLSWDGGGCAISDTRRDRETRAIVHLVPPDTPRLAAGTAVTQELDWARRHRHMRIHTCLHLLSVVIKAGVTSGNLSAESGRLDFDLPEGMELDREHIENELNRLVAEDRAVRIEMSSGEALQRQPELIKTMSVTPPLHLPEIRLINIDGIDLQPCGGTHVRSTGEIGPVVVKKIESKGARNKRVVVALRD
ncbi:alanyl-tRNA editing protein [Chromobacterium haemolyticum]|uniref:Alanine--tRNA ligase n=1 Tax=Chromobacterium haemolyticum TaxID=394935 RepID=A0ABS3GMT2_9NEIS|nr:alanyl-tRNA editing protein [Chromobacterium haemolyticum]MBK0414965.1 alanyl-tRNA editing protein [Chromobacterium haemolyticum]MBO0416365.1 alanyl-tRNA editing protein [Chromobacterium haemolyticum]MBO0499603.1 alanyl-tRNA editing protein [Chromobacterium haemolyticum]